MSAVSDLKFADVDGIVIGRVHAVHVLVAHQRRDLAQEEEEDDGAGHEPRRRGRRRRRREAEAKSLPRGATPAAGARHASGPGGLFMGLKKGRKARHFKERERRAA